MLPVVVGKKALISGPPRRALAAAYVGRGATCARTCLRAVRPQRTPGSEAPSRRFAEAAAALPTVALIGIALPRAGMAVAAAAAPWPLGGAVRPIVVSLRLLAASCGNLCCAEGSAVVGRTQMSV